MSSIRSLGIGLLTLVFMGGCESTPTVTRTGDVKDIIIGEKLSAPEVSVNQGDEVRWVNKRTAPVQIVFLDPVANDRLSCKNNIGGLMTRSDTAKLATNESASACFRDVGQARYTVRIDSTLPGDGITNIPGVIQVGGKMGDAAAQTREQSRSRAGDRISDLQDGQSSGQASAPPSTTSTTTTTTTTTAPAK